MQTVLGSAKSLLETISAGGGWSWAQTDKVQGEIKRAVDALEQAVKQNRLVGLLFIGTEAATIKSTINQADLQSQTESCALLTEQSKRIMYKVQQAVALNQQMQAFESTQ